LAGSQPTALFEGTSVLVTNLIVLGHMHLNGAGFLARMWAPALAALVVTAPVVATLERRGLKMSAGNLTSTQRPVLGLGLSAVVVGRCSPWFCSIIVSRTR